MSGIHFSTLHLTVQGVEVELAVQRRPGPGPTLLSLHGFGSTKEEYADLALLPAFAGYDLIAYDAPGFGASSLRDPAALSIPFLVEVAGGLCDALGLSRLHLTGHSMGGLSALLFAQAHPDRVKSLFNIEGNIAPEDCFLSRQIVEHGAEGNDAFLAGFIERVRARREFGAPLYAAGLAAKVRPHAPRPVFTSMVELSDTAPLMETFAALPLPRAFVYGEQNRHLSYLADLPGHGIEVIEIAQSGHFPMYSNPVALWAALADFLKRHEAS